MTLPPPSPVADLGAWVRTWLPVIVIVMGGMGAWFNLNATVQRIQERHDEWRIEQLQAMSRIQAAIDREQNETRALLIEFAVIKAGNDAIREHLRRIEQRTEARERAAVPGAAREVLP